jgi:hypothetical protein
VKKKMAQFGGTNSGSSFAKEYDSQIRSCIFYVIVEPIKKIRNWLNHESAQHWALVVKFDNRTIRYELIPDSQGIIRPCWSNIIKSDSSDSSEQKWYHVGKMDTISPKILHEIAESHGMNQTKYSPVNNNCQHWVCHLLNRVDPKLEVNVKLNGLIPLNESPLKTAATGISKLKHFKIIAMQCQFNFVFVIYF